MAEHAPHLTCVQVVELVTDYLERALDAGDAELFEQHLLTCDGCEFYLEQIRRTTAVAGGIQEAAVPDATRARLLETFRAWKAGP